MATTTTAEPVEPVTPPEEVAAPEAAAAEGATPSTDPNAGIENVRAQLEAERKGREEERQRAARAEAEAQAAREREAAAMGETKKTQLDLVNTAISNVNQTLDSLEAQAAAASEAGDHKLVAKINREMALHSTRLTQLETGKQQMEAHAKNPPRPAPRPAVNPVEEFISRTNPAATRAHAWLRAHPECVTNPVLHRKMIAAHEIALADNIPPESDAYFDTIETMLKLKPANAPPPPAPREEVTPENPFSEAAAPARRAPPAAPVSRGGNGTITLNGSQRGARLTPAEREAAEISGQTEEEYAAAKIETARRLGKLN